MSATITRIGLGAVALFLCVACDPQTAGPDASTQSGSATASGASTAPSTTAAKFAPSASAKPKKRKTTSAAIAVRNVNAKLPQLQKQMELTPHTLAPLEGLQALLMTRSSRLGKISDLDRVVELGEEAVKRKRHMKDALLIRAKAHSAVHRFADALKDMDEAEKLGATTYKTELSRAAILIALHQVDEGLAIVEARRKAQGDSFETLFAEAMARGHMGQYAEADALYAKALDSFRSLSPFPVAHVDFERGAMWDRAGDEERAIRFYRDAVERLPQFAHAAGHLAYKLPHDEAVKLVKGLIESSDDPEYVGTLGYLMNKKEPGSGDAEVEKAKGLYDALLKKHPLAFADHAGWFYVVIAKDFDKAIEMAEMNLENRATPEAFELMLAALVGGGEGSQACEVADRAASVKYPTLGLKRRMAAAYEMCGRKGEADELRAAADAMEAAAKKLGAAAAKR